MLTNVLIVLNYNDKETTQDFLDSVKEYQSVDHIVVVDNHSTDDSFSMLRKNASEKISVIRTKKNRGYAYGNDYGIRFAKKYFPSTFYTIANPDVSFGDETLLKMIEIASRLPKVGQIACKMNNLSSVELPMASRIPTFTDCVMNQLLLLKKVLRYQEGYSEQKFKRDIVPVEVVPGSFFVISAKAYEECGGFDRHTFLYYEEAILAKRLKDAGYQNYLLSGESYIHKHSVSVDKTFPKKRKQLQIAYRSRVYYCEKYLNIGTGKRILLAFTFYWGLWDYLFAKKIAGLFEKKS